MGCVCCDCCKGNDLIGIGGAGWNRSKGEEPPKSTSAEGRILALVSCCGDGDGNPVCVGVGGFGRPTPVAFEGDCGSVI